MAVTNVFVNVNANAVASSRVVSLTNNQAEAWQKFTIGDNRNFQL